MAWTSMHFAVGMAGAGALGAVGCAIAGRGWRWLPLAMTAGGFWALVPDLPRLWREDFPWLPLASTLGSRNVEAFIHHHLGDLFFLHGSLDRMCSHQGAEYALHGLALIIELYNLAILALMVMEKRAARGFARRSWVAHAEHVTRLTRVREDRQAKPQPVSTSWAGERVQAGQVDAHRP